MKGFKQYFISQNITESFSLIHIINRVSKLHIPA